MSNILYLTFKTPDIDLEIKQYCTDNDMYYEDVQKKLARWIEYGELITVKFDMIDGSAEILPR